MHCHNDLGLAVANSLAAVVNGATQVECTMNGMGERAGNASMEEIVMGIQTRKDYYGEFKHSIDTRQIYRTSKLVSKLTGVNLQPHKAIVGKMHLPMSPGSTSTVYWLKGPHMRS